MNIILSALILFFTLAIFTLLAFAFGYAFGYKRCYNIFSDEIEEFGDWLDNHDFYDAERELARVLIKIEKRLTNEKSDY